MVGGVGPSIKIAAALGFDAALRGNRLQQLAERSRLGPVARAIRTGHAVDQTCAQQRLQMERQRGSADGELGHEPRRRYTFATPTQQATEQRQTRGLGEGCEATKREVGLHYLIFPEFSN